MGLLVEFISLATVFANVGNDLTERLHQMVGSVRSLYPTTLLSENTYLL
jgi:hypothetical protein